MPSEIVLSLMVGTTNPQPAPREVMEALTKVEVTGSTSDKSGFDLTFAISKKSLLNTQLLPSGYFDPPTRVVISVIVRGQVNVLMDGVITRQELVPSDESGRSVLSIKGEDVSRMMDLIDFTGFPFAAMPAEARVAIMVAKYIPLYQIVPIVVPSVLIDVPNPIQQIPVQRGTDLTYIKQLGDRVGYSFFVHPGPEPGMNLAYWGPIMRSPIPFLPTPTPLAIDWDGRSNVESLQFTFDGFAKTQWVVLIQQGTFPIPIPVPDVNPLSPPLGSKSPMPLKVSPMVGLAKYSPLRAAALALAKAATTSNVIGASGTLDVLRYGSVLPVHTVVEVRGAGITYDGQYFVDSTSHTIKPGSYKQSFSLSRNALIAGSGNPLLDTMSYLTSGAQSLASFAASPQPPPVTGASGVPILPGPLLPSPQISPPSAGSVVPLPASP